MEEISHKGHKTLWEKEKLLVTSNFSFSHSVCKRLVQQTRKRKGLFEKGLGNLDHGKGVFVVVDWLMTSIMFIGTFAKLSQWIALI